MISPISVNKSANIVVTYIFIELIYGFLINLLYPLLSFCYDRVRD